MKFLYLWRKGCFRAFEWLKKVENRFFRYPLLKDAEYFRLRVQFSTTFLFMNSFASLTEMLFPVTLSQQDGNKQTNKQTK